MSATQPVVETADIDASAASNARKLEGLRFALHNRKLQ